jgi:uncharacterized integral membrane protein (TIGR00698 family)
MAAMTECLKANNKFVYVSLLVIQTLVLLIDFIPGASPYTHWLTPPVALFLGLAFALLCGQAHPKFNKKTSKYLLQYSVVGLGFGMNLHAALASGKEGMEFTILSVVGTMLIGWFIGRKVLKVDRDTSYLISSGTAICGGSAIAAVGPVLRAKDSEMSVALGTIFVLNAIALFVFPVIGHWLGMSQHEFGTWAAIAIHDTSSVVGAGAAYGEEALKVATTIKLTRALWIIPLAFVTSFLFKSKGQKVSIPWFIFFFILAMVVNTYMLAGVPQVGQIINHIARKGLTITLFFIGASLSRDVLKSVGVKPVEYDSAFTFIYSKRTGTPAAAMEDQCDPEEVKRHFDLLLKEVQQISAKKAMALEGKVMEVLAEEQNTQDASLITGRLSNNSVVHFPGTPDMIGKLFMVKLTECKGFYYLGEIAENA